MPMATDHSAATPLGGREGGATPSGAWRRIASGWGADARTWRRRLVVALGALWVLDGLLQFQPAMYSRGPDSFAATVLQYNTMGRPNLLTDLIRFAVTLTYGSSTHEVVFNTLAAVTQVAIGVGLLVRRTERLALVASACWAIVPWVVGEALGQLLFPQTTMAITGAPGAALVYLVLSLALWPRRSRPEGEPSPSLPPPAPAEGGLLGRRGALVVWALAWGGTALLELERANWAPNAISAQLAELASREPGFLAALDRLTSSATFGHGTEIALVLALVQLWIATAALRPPTRTTALAVGIVVSIVFWVVGQNLGGLFTGTASDPNLGPPMVLLALALWPRTGAPGAGADPDPPDAGRTTRHRDT
ncbi:MAG: hypothetical protein ACYCV5_01200 [Acidimicrobiales bacterium]